jgi:hypothetical protein
MTKNVINKDGVVVSGLFRTNTGALVVNNPMEFKKYSAQRQTIQNQQEKIKTLEEQIQELKMLMQQILENKNG